MFCDTLLNSNEGDFDSSEQQKRRKTCGENAIILDLIKKIEKIEIINVSCHIETKILLIICKLCNLIIQNKTKKILMKKDSNVFYIFCNPW